MMNNRSNRRRSIMGMLLATAVLSACSAAAVPARPSEPMVDVATEGAGNEITFSTGASVAFIDVRSERGIGRATITRVAGQWPEVMTMRLHLRGLENLQVSDGSTKLALSLTRSGQLLQSANSADDGELAVTDDSSPYWMVVRFVDEMGDASATIDPAGAILVDLPPDYMAGAGKRIELEWIDFYR